MCKGNPATQRKQESSVVCVLCTPSSFGAIKWLSVPGRSSRISKRLPAFPEISSLSNPPRSISYAPPTHHILRCNVRPRLQQQPRHLRMALVRSDVQRRLSHLHCAPLRQHPVPARKHPFVFTPPWSRNLTASRPGGLFSLRGGGGLQPLYLRFEARTSRRPNEQPCFYRRLSQGWLDQRRRHASRRFSRESRAQSQVLPRLQGNRKQGFMDGDALMGKKGRQLLIQPAVLCKNHQIEQYARPD